jgi:hypothetical protein
LPGLPKGDKHQRKAALARLFSFFDGLVIY